MAAIYLNGKLVDRDKAVISVYDHGFLYGDGVFEGLRFYNRKIFKLREHLERLYDSARHIALIIPQELAALAADTQACVAACGMDDGYIRLVVSRGEGNLGLDPRSCPNPTVIIIADAIKLYPAEMYEQGMEVVTAATIRNHPDALDPRVKSLNYLNNILAKLEANRAGVPEAVMLNHLGQVAECTADNIFVVRHGVLSTPARHCGILDGVTRRTVLDLAASLGVPNREETLTRHDLFTADEMFLTGTGAEIIPVTRVDARPIGSGKPGPVTARLREAYHKLVRS
ncbi:MAG: branched-chain-amino-acid transaminase [Gemmataceae bacterium]|jgi:branched-chain amino acid aminotransferase|nr:branched-chain-amino-acid transaminase [Gemmataceae bacterium]